MVKTIKKNDIVSHLYTKLGLSKKEVSNIVNDTFAIIEETLIEKEDVKINLFGSFRLHTRKEKTVKNPKTGEDNKVPEQETVIFKSSKKFKDYLLRK